MKIKTKVKIFRILKRMGFKVRSVVLYTPDERAIRRGYHSHYDRVIQISNKILCEKISLSTGKEKRYDELDKRFFKVIFDEGNGT